MKPVILFKYLFILVLPSVLVTFAGNSILFISVSLIALIKLGKRYPENFSRQYIWFSSFILSIFIATCIDLYNGQGFQLREITKRLAFVLMPVVFVYSRKSHQALALKVFVYFLSTFSIILLSAGLFRAWFNKGEVIYGNWDSQTTEAFYAQEMFLNWGELSYKRLFLFIDMHPSYYAFFSATVLLVLIFTNLIRIRRWRYLALLVLHSTMILLISSKGGIISLFVIIGASFFNQKNIKNMALGVLAIILLGLISISIPSTRVRLEKAYNEMVSPAIQKEKGTNQGRLVLWNTLKNYSKLELVTGIGTKTARERVLKLTGEDKNMHNQFIQALVSSGILGLILLICFLALPLIYSRHFFAYLFVSILCIFLLLENMMDRIWGIMLISFFYSLFIFGDQNLLKKRNNSTKRLV